MFPSNLLVSKTRLFRMRGFFLHAYAKNYQIEVVLIIYFYHMM